MATMPAGHLLKQWRERRRITQLELSLEAEISTRHLSFVETGRSQPSREMVLRLAERLDVPLRERNALLLAAGFAPIYTERDVHDQALHRALEIVLRGQEPYPALAIDRHWNLIASNSAVAPMLQGVDATLLEPPVNVLRLSIHQGGLAPRIVNFDEWREHLLDRVRRQVEVSADPVLVDLLREIRESAAAGPVSQRASHDSDYAGLIVPIQLRMGDAVLSFFSTTTVFGTPLDVTLSEIAIESFFPADAGTAAAMAR
jgi:transcriptional regulator with XRE-family HTH domain